MHQYNSITFVTLGGASLNSDCWLHIVLIIWIREVPQINVFEEKVQYLPLTYSGIEV